MTILVNFSDRNRGESRAEFLQRKFLEAHQASIEDDCTVTVEGYFYESDLNIIGRITNGLEPIRKFRLRSGGYRTVFQISANPPRMPLPYEF